MLGDCFKNSLEKNVFSYNKASPLTYIFDPAFQIFLVYFILLQSAQLGLLTEAL